MRRLEHRSAAARRRRLVCTTSAEHEEHLELVARRRVRTVCREALPCVQATLTRTRTCSNRTPAACILRESFTLSLRVQLELCAKEKFPYFR